MESEYGNDVLEGVETARGHVGHPDLRLSCNIPRNLIRVLT